MTISDKDRRVIQSLGDKMTPNQLADALKISPNSVKAILKEDEPEDDIAVEIARYKLRSAPNYEIAQYFREELGASKCKQEGELAEAIAYVMTDMERAEPYNCKWGYIRQEHIAKWIFALKRQGEYVGLDEPPQEWLDSRDNDPSGAKQPKGYIPYVITSGTAQFRGYWYDWNKGSLFYDDPILQESTIGVKADCIEIEILESLGHYQKLIEEQTAKGSKSRMTWIKLQSLANQNMHAITDLRDTWRGWHYGQGMAIQWRL